MFTLMCDIFIMCFVFSEILSLEEEEGGFFTVKLQEYSPK